MIFDMDGVLLDSEASYRSSVERFFGDRGVVIPVHELNEIAGSSHEDYRAHIARWWERIPELSAEDAALGPQAAIHPYYVSSPEEVAALASPGLRETLDSLAERGIALGLASSSPMREIRSNLEALGVDGHFSAIVSGDDLARSKPFPDVYLKAMELLGVDWRQAIAVEDSDPGIEAARRAGLAVAAKRDDRFGFTQAGAQWLFDELPELVTLVDRLA